MNGIGNSKALPHVRELPAGGALGQVLVKASGSDGHVRWDDVAAAPAPDDVAASKAVTMTVTSSWQAVDIDSIRGSIPEGMLVLFVEVTSPSFLGFFAGILSWSSSVSEGFDDETFMYRAPGNNNALILYFKVKRNSAGYGPGDLMVASTGTYVSLSFTVGFKTLMPISSIP